jgi:hypothetical protein
MRRWDFTAMMNAGRKLFANIHRQKHHEEIMRWFIQVCRDSAAKSIAATLLDRAAIKRSYPASLPAGLNVHATA